MRRVNSTDKGSSETLLEPSPDALNYLPYPGLWIFSFGLILFANLSCRMLFTELLDSLVFWAFLNDSGENRSNENINYSKRSLRSEFHRTPASSAAYKCRKSVRTHETVKHSVSKSSFYSEWTSWSREIQSAIIGCELNRSGATVSLVIMNSKLAPVPIRYPVSADISGLFGCTAINKR